MKILVTLAAAAFATAALALPASAGQIGCDPSDDMTSVKATNCDLWQDGSYAWVPPAPAARVYAPRRSHHATRRAQTSRRAYASEAYGPGDVPAYAFAPFAPLIPGYANGPRSHNDYGWSSIDNRHTGVSGGSGN